jgi:hypothetical protein
MVGFKQVWKKTPDVIKNVRATLIYTIAGSLHFTATLSETFGTTPLGYAEWCGIAILLVKAISMFFGISDEEEVQEAYKVIKEKNKI